MLIIPCGGKKIISAVPVQAWTLYAGSFFTTIWKAAITLDWEIRILSAGYGLLKPNDMILPYNRKMDKTLAALFRTLIPRPLERTGAILPKQYLEAVPWAEPLMKPGLSIGKFLQAVNGMRLDQIIAPTNYPDGEIRAFIPYPE